MTTENPIAARIVETAKELGLAMQVEFVPWSQSRNKGEKSPSLNWNVSITCKGKPLLETPYSAGCAHAPSYRHQWGKRTLQDRDNDLMVRWECETGGKANGISPGGSAYGGKQGTARPKFEDVVYGLMMDATAIDAGSFEAWAQDCGYDTDSRKAQAIYDTCVSHGLKLRAALGDAGMRALREACQDY